MSVSPGEDLRDVVAPGLEDLGRRVAACRVCRDAPLEKTPLPHEPRPVLRISRTARIAICGQAPGARVHASGLPFDDPSGDRLRDWLGVDRAVFYDVTRVAIIPMGFCFPGLDAKGGDLPPRKECARTWHDEIFAAMPQIGLVLAIGAYAQSYHLGTARRKTLTETVADWRTIWERDVRPRALPLPHPSWRNTGWLKRHPWFEIDVLPVLKKEVRTLIEHPDQSG
ncbi:MAG: uracil-DNA glycosylase [Hyphomicrobiales bacterium]|nr:MAG: uracil-DNA glycosylase [Hyphomicrobiales bacterium]